MLAPAPTRYRWLSQGQDCRYAPAPGKGLDERRGESCRVLTLPGYKPTRAPKNALVEFADGFRAVVSAWSLRGVRR